MMKILEQKIESLGLERSHELFSGQTKANVITTDRSAASKIHFSGDIVRVSHLTALWCAISIIGDSSYVPLRTVGDDVMNLSIGAPSFAYAFPEKREVAIDFEWRGPVEYADYSTREEKKPGVLYIGENQSLAVSRAVLLPGTSQGLHIVGVRRWGSNQHRHPALSIELPFWLRLMMRLEGKNPNEVSFDEALRLCIKHAASRSSMPIAVGEVQWHEPSGRTLAILSSWVLEERQQSRNSMR